MGLSFSAEIWGFLFIGCSLAISFPSARAVTQVQRRLRSAREMERQLFSMSLIFNSSLLMFP